MRIRMRFLLGLLAAVAAWGQNTAKFPAAVPTYNDLGVVANRAATTLLTGVSASATSLPVASGTQFGAPGFVTIDNEVIAICAKAGNALTVGYKACPNIDGRGWDASSALSHLAGRPVQQRIVAWTPNQLAAEVIAIATKLHNEMVSVTDFGADPTDDEDDTEAFQAALDLGNYYAVNVPCTGTGRFLITETLRVSGTGVKVLGQGQRCAFIEWAPDEAGKPLFLIQSLYSNQIGQNKISGLSIRGSGDLVKLGISMVDAAEIEVTDIALSGITDSTKGSTGIRVAGRQSINIHDVLVDADKPMVIGEDPNTPGWGADHMHVWNWYSIANGNPHLTVEDGTAISNMTWDGYQAWAKGTYGVYWVTPNTYYASLMIAFHNVRFEQVETTAGWIAYFAPNSIQDLLIDGMYGGITGDPVPGLSSNGYYFRNITNGVMIRSCYAGYPTFGGSYVAINADGSAAMMLIAMAWTREVTKTLTGFTGLELSADGSIIWHTPTVSIGNDEAGMNLHTYHLKIGHDVASSHFMSIPNNHILAAVNGAGDETVGIVSLGTDDVVTIAPTGARVRFGTLSTVQFGYDQYVAPISAYNSKTASLNASAPASVPGCSGDLGVSIDSAVGDVATVAAPVALPAGFSLSVYVGAANSAFIRWCQLSGEPADPDGAGGDYRVTVVRHPTE